MSDKSHGLYEMPKEGKRALQEDSRYVHISGGGAGGGKAFAQRRAFNPATHLRTFEGREWEVMYDDQGNALEGIRGISGASEVGYDGELIGADMIELQPGASFPLHTHPGDHILYAIAGEGTVTIAGAIHHFEAGSTFFIAAEYPHGVGTYSSSPTPFFILAVGHPQKHVSDQDRMTVIREEEARS